MNQSNLTNDVTAAGPVIDAHNWAVVLYGAEHEQLPITAQRTREAAIQLLFAKEWAERHPNITSVPGALAKAIAYFESRRDNYTYAWQKELMSELLIAAKSAQEVQEQLNRWKSGCEANAADAVDCHRRSDERRRRIIDLEHQAGDLRTLVGQLVDKLEQIGETNADLRVAREALALAREKGFGKAQS